MRVLEREKKIETNITQISIKKTHKEQPKQFEECVCTSYYVKVV